MIDREVAIKLQDIVGSAISHSPTQLITYASDMWPKHQIYKLMGRFGEHPPDAVVWPQNIQQISSVMRVLKENGIPVIPAGGLSGVCGGTVPIHGGVILDLKRMNRVIELDRPSATVEVEAGILGIVLEEWLNEKGYTLGHFPSSIMSSTVGGYAATRSAGQFSSKYGKFEDMILGATFITADGRVLELNAMPGESARQNPLHILVGSEGTLGVFARLKLKLWPKPAHRLLVGIRFGSVKAGLEMMRNIMQTGLDPMVLRLYDPLDTLVNRLSESEGNKKKTWYQTWLSDLSDYLMGPAMKEVLNRPYLIHSGMDLLPLPVLLVMGFEGDSGRITRSMDLGMQIAKKNKGHYLGNGPGERWYRDRYKVSFKQSGIFKKGGFVDTIEVAAPWDRVFDVYEAVRNAVGRKVVLMAHFSHAYPNGCSVYFTFSGWKSETSRLMDLYQSTVWQILQTAIKHGATVSHHHGIGLMKRDFTPLEYQGGERIFSGLKASLDPDGRMNPGKVYALSPKGLQHHEKSPPMPLTKFMGSASYLFNTEPPNIVRGNVPEDVASLLRFAIRYGVPVSAQTLQTPKKAKLQGKVYLDLSNMDEIISLSPLSEVLTVQAGVTVDNIEAFLNQKGYSLGWYPKTKGRLSIGTYVATGGSGVFSPLYGEIKDQVMGISAVLPTGEIFKVKPAPRRAAGPDMTGLFVGGQGAFGVITGLCMRVFELPRTRQFFAFTGDDPIFAISALRSALCKGVRPARVFAVVRSPDRVLEEGRVRVVVEFTGDAMTVGHDADLLVSLMSGAGFTSVKVRKKVKDWLGSALTVFSRPFRFSKLLGFLDALPRDPKSGFPDVFITSLSKHSGTVYVIKKDPLQSLPDGFERQWARKCDSTDTLIREWKKKLDPAGILNTGVYEKDD